MKAVEKVEVGKKRRKTRSEQGRRKDTKRRKNESEDGDKEK